MSCMMAAGDTPGYSAARLKLPCREAASNANSAFSGGILDRCGESSSSDAEFFEMALIPTARYVSLGLRQFSYCKPPEATESCPKTDPRTTSGAASHDCAAAASTPHGYLFV